jgi:hypothetical protein
VLISPARMAATSRWRTRGPYVCKPEPLIGEAV